MPVKKYIIKASDIEEQLGWNYGSLNQDDRRVVHLFVQACEDLGLRDYLRHENLRGYARLMVMHTTPLLLRESISSEPLRKALAAAIPDAGPSAKVRARLLAALDELLTEPKD